MENKENCNHDWRAEYIGYGNKFGLTDICSKCGANRVSREVRSYSESIRLEQQWNAYCDNQRYGGTK